MELEKHRFLQPGQHGSDSGSSQGTQGTPPLSWIFLWPYRLSLKAAKAPHLLPGPTCRKGHEQANAHALHTA